LYFYFFIGLQFLAGQSTISRLTQSPNSLAATLFGLPAGAGWTRVSTGFGLSDSKKIGHYFSCGFVRGQAVFKLVKSFSAFGLGRLKSWRL
jgi:hypothetical protein